MSNQDLNLDQILQEAIQHHHAGRLQKAESLYRQILQHNPRHAQALHLLGVLATQAQRLDLAVDFIRQAIAVTPNFPQAYCNLGNALKDQGRLDEAIAAYRQAIALKAHFPLAHYNLGVALKALGRLDEAIAAYRQAINLKAHFPLAYYNLGVALRDQGQLDEAIAAFRQTIALQFNFAEAHNNLGNALRSQGRLDEAIAAYRKAIGLQCDFAEAHNNLGIALADRGQFNEAIAAFRQAIAFRPQFPQAHYNLGNALKDQRRLDEAIAAFRQAISLKPDFAEAHTNLGVALKDKGLHEAVAAFLEAASLKPDLPEASVNLGNVLKDQGRLDEAIAAYRQAIAVNPDFQDAYSNLLLILHYHPGFDGQAIAQELRLWNQQHAEPLRPSIQPHANDRNPERQLRIGYVSPDLRDHVVGRFLLPLLTCHNRREVEVFAYAQVPWPDAMTQRLRSNTHQWRSIVGCSDAQVADQIRQDQIDILVDLTLHTAHNRLLVFARKPAPVQVTWLGYPGSTGLTTIDYRLSDPYLDPPGMDESLYSEQTVRLPETYWCYQPTSDLAEVSPVPALERGFITFGCLNNFCKVSEPTLATWSRLLRAIPRSQLLLHSVEGSHRLPVQALLEQDGIDAARVRFTEKVPRPDYFRLYHEIDIALDPFPFGGGTTTCDALLMGVPVVSLAGRTAVGRGGLSILSNIGLPELVATNEEHYVRIAGELAADLPRLSQLRSTLRARMEKSPLMDAPRLARAVEAAYRQMWRKWCANNR